MDVPPKAFNSEWSSFGLVPFEDTMRNEVGRVLSPVDVSTAGAAASDLLDGAAGFAAQIRAGRDREIFNFGSAAAAGAAVIDSLLDP